IPFALAVGLLVVAAVYTLVQFVTVATIGSTATDRPLVETASVLIGRSGATFVAVAVMFSTYGIIAGGVLNAPRLMYALSAQRDLPRSLTRLHLRYQTPSRAILIYVGLAWLFALTGTFLWLVAVVAGAFAIMDVGMCAALIRLRKLQPSAPG